MRREDIKRQDSLIAGERAREDELMARQDTRQDELIGRQEKREDLTMARQEAIARAREIRQDLMRQQERTEDRTFQGGLAETQASLQRELAGGERELMTTRFDREDRRSIEEQSTEQIAALDNRIQDLQDMVLKGEVLGEAGEIERQISEAEGQKLAVRSRLVERLFEMGDARYKDLPADQRDYAAGYSKDQVVRRMRLRQGGSGAEEAQEAEPNAARSSEQIGADLAAAESTTGRSGGLSAQDRAALGLSSSGDPAMSAPQSPEPLRDMTKEGRGKRGTGFGGKPGLADELEMLRRKPWIRRPEVRKSMGLPPLSTGETGGGI